MTPPERTTRYTAEVWRPILGCDGYEVSNHGRVRSPKRPHGLVFDRWRGYCYVGLGLRRRGRVHRLVLEAFVGPPPTPRHEVNHKNGVKDDNRVENLEWVTRSQNHAHACANGLSKPPRKMGETHGHAKLTSADVIAIRSRRADGELCRALASEYGVHPSAIYKIWERKAWRHL